MYGVLVLTLALLLILIFFYILAVAVLSSSGVHFCQNFVNSLAMVSWFFHSFAFNVPHHSIYRTFFATTKHVWGA